MNHVVHMVVKKVNNVTTDLKGGVPIIQGTYADPEEAHVIASCQPEEHVVCTVPFFGYKFEVKREVNENASQV